MGYGCYEKDGRDQGYMVPAVCDHPECGNEINRGIDYSCGGDPTENCGLFFCHEHKAHDIDAEAGWTEDKRHEFGVCERCAVGLQPFEPSLDTEYWVAWKMNHGSWSNWRAENPDFVRQHVSLIGHDLVMKDMNAEEQND